MTDFPLRSPRLLVATTVALVSTLSACRSVDPAADGGDAVASPEVYAVNASPRSVSASYLAGRHAMTHRDLRAAARYFGTALERDPENDGLLRRTFLVELSRGEIERAEELAAQVIETDPDNPTAQYVLAMKSVRENDFASADRRLAALSDDGLNAFIRPLLRGWVLAGLERWDEADAELAALRDNQGSATLYELHAGLMRDYQDRLDMSVKHMRAVLAAQNRIPMRVAKAAVSVLMRAGKIEEARTLFDRYAGLYPDSLILDRLAAQVGGASAPARSVGSVAQGLAEGLFDLASILHQERVSDTALLYAQMALWLRPGMDVARMLLGEIYEGQHRHRDAIDAYGKVAPDSPFSWTARLRVAENLGEIDELDRALKILEGMATERDERYDALTQIGNLLRGRERFVEAAKAYDRAIDRIGEDLRQRHWSLFYARGIALERSRQWPRAETDFLHALELEPEQPYVLNYLGYSWIEQGVNIDRARAMIERAVEQRPNDGYIVDSLGWVFYRLGQYHEAVVNLERAVELRPQDPTINDHLGDAYWQVGRYAEARFQWSRSLSLDPEEKEIAKIRSKLEEGLGSSQLTASD